MGGGVCSSMSAGVPQLVHTLMLLMYRTYIPPYPGCRQRGDGRAGPGRSGGQAVPACSAQPGDAQLPLPGLWGPPAALQTLLAAPGSPAGFQTGQ